MWFKNIQAFTLTPWEGRDLQEFEEDLAQLPASDCGKFEAMTYGWVPPLGQHTETLIHSSQRDWLIAARKHEKVVPPAVVKDQLQDRVESIQEEQGRPVGAREKSALREEIAFSLLPQAFCKSTVTHAYIDGTHQWLMLDSVSASVAKQFIALLQKVIPDVKILPIEAKSNVNKKLTEWMFEEPPENFTLKQHCELIDPRQVSRVIRISNYDLGKSEILSHIKNGMEVNKIALSWCDRISFTLDNHLNLRQIRFEDELKDAAEEIYGDNEASRHDADFAIMVGEMRALYGELVDHFGGIAPAGSTTTQEAPAKDAIPA